MNVYKTDAEPVLPAVEVLRGTNTRNPVKSHANLPTYLVKKSATEAPVYR